MQPQRAGALLDAFGRDPAALFAASPAEWRGSVPSLPDALVARLSTIQTRSFAKECAALERLGGRLIAFDDPCYPANLRPLTDAPPVLIARGELVPEDKFSVAIVGSRRASPYGLTLAKRFAQELAAHGLTVISGGARGVDTQAHLGAHWTAAGARLPFLAPGLTSRYPGGQSPPVSTSIAGGQRGGRFRVSAGLRSRNPGAFPPAIRLISGTALGVLVIESPCRQRLAHHRARGRRPGPRRLRHPRPH